MQIKDQRGWDSGMGTNVAMAEKEKEASGLETYNIGKMGKSKKSLTKL